MAHTYRSHFFHLFWSTKLRQNLITSEVQNRLYHYIGGLIKSMEGRLVEIGGTENHVHLLIGLNKVALLEDLVRTAKARSTLWVRQTFPQKQYFGWQQGYGSFSVSFSQLDVLINYIRNQEEHHKTESFEDEFTSFLRKMQIQYDERFVLDNEKPR